jgi:hypothetical protein
MKRTARTIASFMLACLASLIGLDARAQQWAREMFDHTSHDFGTVARGAKVEHRFGVENVYLEDAHIKSAVASCGCTSPEVPAQILKTYNKAYVVAKIDTIHFDGQKDVTIKVEFDRPFFAEVQLHIHCFIRKDVVVEPGAVHFRTAQATAAQQRVIVRYAGNPNWQILRIECGNPSISSKVTEIGRGNGVVTYELLVNLAADAKAGYSRDELNLVTNDANPRAQRVPVAVESQVVAPVSVHPSPLIMEPVAAGKLENPVVRPLVIVSSSPFQITGATSTNPRFRCDLLPAAAATIQRLPVTFLGSAALGKIDTRIRIQTTASAQPIEAEVNIQVTQPTNPQKAEAAEKGPADRPEAPPVDPVFGPPGPAIQPRTSTAKEF